MTMAGGVDASRISWVCLRDGGGVGGIRAEHGEAGGQCESIIRSNWRCIRHGRGVRDERSGRPKPPADGDYVLTSTKIISGTAPSAPARSAGEGAAGAAAGLMYDIEGIPKDQLEKHVGKRVQIDGAFDHLDNAKLPVTFVNDLVEIKGTALRSVPGACPAK
jgi:hypothetical protein